MKRLGSLSRLGVIALGASLACRGGPPDPSDIASLHLFIRSGGSDIQTLGVEITASNLAGVRGYALTVAGGVSTVPMEIPVGRGRSMTVRALDAFGLETHRGATTFDLSADVNPLITFTLEPSDNRQPVSVTLATFLLLVEPEAPATVLDRPVSLLGRRVNPTGDTTTVVPTWTSEDLSIATVDDAGVVTPLALGAVNIQADVDGTSAIAVVTIEPAVMAGAGDIAVCSSTDDEATASLLDGIPGIVFTAGDNAYDSGTDLEFANCYDPSWGRHRERTYPSPGNHDYGTAGAAGYFGYFGERAGPPNLGYYAFNYGGWRIYSLNSNVQRDAGSTQEQWLRADLAATGRTCAIGFWHHARFSSSRHGNDTSMIPLYQALYEGGADLAVVGHDHVYERFAPQTHDGVADVQAIRQFVVGTGGRFFYELNTPEANSEFRDNTHFGVLKLTLFPASYQWEFVSAPDGTVLDSGAGDCH